MEIKQHNTEPSHHHDLKELQTSIKTEREVRLTSSELANLWASWMESSIKERIVQYFIKIVEDPDIKQALEYFLEVAKKHLKIISQIYAREKHPIPIGFTDEDVNLDAPRLFTDSLILYFLKDIAVVRLDGYSTALQMSVRSDVRKFFTECVADSAEMYNRTVSIMLSKGLNIRPPYIPVPEKVDFIKKQNYLAGYLGKQRTLNSIEISHIFLGLQKNLLRGAVFNGFGHVTASEQVKKYMVRGKKIANKHIKIFSSLLINNNLPVSMAWDSGVIDSNIAPFSDKLMMQQARVNNSVLIAAYWRAVPVMRRDLGLDFTRLAAEVLKYLEDGFNILIENSWLEEPPQAKKLLH
ncbi:MAG: DUF3231 family protein [Desulfotomaculaceae bacterium]|nr:DUF3231 family protein [Desulfotomaculaceae bacterium]